MVKRIGHLVAALVLLSGIFISGVASAAPTITTYPLPTDSDRRPQGITTGPDGALWFTEQFGNKIGRMTTAGVLTEYTIPTANSQPVRITSGPDGALWFTEGNFGKIGRITTSGAITEYSVPGFPSSGLWGITTGQDGALWFTMPANQPQVGRITTSGTITMYPLGGGNGSPFDIVTGPDGALWFPEGGSDKVGRVTTAGVITQFTLPAHAVPTSIAVGTDGAFWMTSGQGDGKVYRMTTAGDATSFPILANSTSSAIAVGADGALWITVHPQNQLIRMTNDGTFISYTLPNPPQGGSIAPNGITAGPDHAMWFTGALGNSVTRAGLDANPGPAVPANLTINSGNSVPVELNWNTVSGAQYYVIYRNGVKVNESFSSANFIDRSAHTGLNTYYVTAVDANGESDPSNTASMTASTQRHVLGTLRINGQTLPATPYSSAAMQLMDNSGTPRTGSNAIGTSSYDINTSGISNGFYGMSMQYSNALPSLDVNTTNLPSQFWLKEVGAPILNAPGDTTQNIDFTTKRLEVTVLDAQGHPSSTSVSVSNVGDSTITNNVDQTAYTVLGGYENSGGHTDVAGKISFALFPGSDIRVCASAINTCRTVTFTDNASITLNPTPAVPANLTAQSPAQTPALSWNAVSGASSYNIYRDSAQIGSGTATTYSDSTASEGLHTYYVTAASGGESGPSNNVTVLVDRTAPTIQSSVAPVTDTNGNNTGNVQVSFTCADNAGGSGIASCTSPITVDNEGIGHTVDGTAVDNAGNSTTIHVDASLLVQAINAGGDATGAYAADANVSGGQPYASLATVDTDGVTVLPAPQAVYQSVRYGNAMSYTLSGLTPNASYTLRLHFNELYWGTALAGGQGGEGSRVFNVNVNGQAALTNYDIYAAAGGANKAIAEQLPVTADSSGNVTVQFTTVTDNAMVSGVELFKGDLPAAPPAPFPQTITSARINAGGSDTGNFIVDTDFNGGTPYASAASVDTASTANPAPQDVYQSVRYGTFSYAVPNLTPNTNFLVRLHFNELYWGTALAGNQGGNGSRVFNASINGSPVLSNFDIYQTAGGANKAVTEDFVVPSDSHGRITIHFTTVTDNAMVSGIEIVPPLAP